MENEYLIQLKGFERKNAFKVHSDKTEVLKKCATKSDKWILTFGYDDANDDVMRDSETSFISQSSKKQEKVLKIWNYWKLMDEDYKDYIDNGFAPQPKGKGRPHVFIIDDSKTEQAP